MLLLRLAHSIKEKMIAWLGCVLFFFVVDFTLKGLSVVFFSFVVVIRKSTYNKLVIFANNTSLTLPVVIEVPVPSQESEQACVCV